VGWKRRNGATAQHEFSTRSFHKRFSALSRNGNTELSDSASWRWRKIIWENPSEEESTCCFALVCFYIFDLFCFFERLIETCLMHLRIYFDVIARSPFCTTPTFQQTVDNTTQGTSPRYCSHLPPVAELFINEPFPAIALMDILLPLSGAVQMLSCFRKRIIWFVLFPAGKCKKYNDPFSDFGCWLWRWDIVRTIGAPGGECGGHRFIQRSSRRWQTS